MNNTILANILWVDDEIESLKSQILFLNNKGYQIETASNGYDALDILQNQSKGIIDIVLLDESMPGITGLELLPKIKSILPLLPIVMITKNEAENIMEEAIGSQISDYLIKPVNPNQVLLSIKKIIDAKRLISEKTAFNYQQEFRSLLMALNDNPNYDEWKELYKKLIFWEIEIHKSNSIEMLEVLYSHKNEANTEFFKFISKNYTNWMRPNAASPILSHQVFKEKIAPQLSKDKPSFLILIDNLRYDQWKTIQPMLNEFFRTVEDDMYYSILPTATQYARNAFFAGVTPLEIEKKFPNYWKNDDDEGGKNLNEEFFLENQIKMLNMEHFKVQYIKITNNESAKILEDNFHNYLKNDLTVIVYNFVDMLSHARTEMEVLKELAGNEVSYRSLTASWFEHSPLFSALKKISDNKVQLFITTDHGTQQVKTPSKVVGDRATTTNLRYKVGKSLQYDNKYVLAIKDPHTVGLPRPNVSSTFIFAREDVFLCYPNNYNHFVNHYRNTFQHGGISLEEMIIPIARLQNK